MVSIIILCKDNLKYTRECIESILQNTSQARTPFEIICVDNGSQDGTLPYLKGLEDGGSVRGIYNQSNLGFPKGCNQGAAIAKGEYLLLLNNDTIIPDSRWLENLLRCIRSDSKIAATSGYSSYSSGYQQSPIPCNYRNKAELEKFAANYNQEEKYVDFLVFFCVLIKRSVWDEIGGLDEDFTPGNFEDNLFCWRAIEKGYKLKIAGNVFIHHYISRTWDKEDKKKANEYARIMARNQKIFLKKIGQYKTISLCMIVSDREKPETLKQCLDSAAMWVDELVLIFNYKYFKRPLNFKFDSYGMPIKTQYVKFTNFSDMRNCSLDEATSDYILWLDTDDILKSPNGLRDVIRRNSDVDVFRIHVLSSTETKTQERIIHPRLFKNHRINEGEKK